jgi:hypothetical protein
MRSVGISVDTSPEREVFGTLSVGPPAMAEECCLRNGELL